MKRRYRSAARATSLSLSTSTQIFLFTLPQPFLPNPAPFQLPCPCQLRFQRFVLLSVPIKCLSLGGDQKSYRSRAPPWVLPQVAFTASPHSTSFPAKTLSPHLFPNQNTTPSPVPTGHFLTWIQYPWFLVLPHLPLRTPPPNASFIILKHYNRTHPPTIRPVMVMARRYEIDELIKLRSSPLVVKPPGLPPIEEWM